MSALVLLFLCGCATQRPVGVVQTSGNPPASGSVFIEPGPVAVACAGAPAPVSIGISVGRTAYAGEAAGDAARSVLDPPNLYDPGLEMAAGPICFVLAPFTAAYSAATAGHHKMSADDLTKSETDLAVAMKALADQTHLRDQVRDAINEDSSRHVSAVVVPETSALGGDSPGTVLETKVEELRLERTDSSETSFALTINTRARLVRASDKAVLFDQGFRYQSGTALFADWTCPNALESVAETGYRELARHIADSLKTARTEAPVVVGAGFKQPSLRKSQAPPVMFAANNMSRRVGPLVQVVSSGPSVSGLGIYSKEVTSHVTIQRPLSKDEAVTEAIQDMQWSLDDMQNSRNSVVMLSACAVAVPWSLCKQTIAVVRGVPQKKLKTADTQLSAAAMEPALQQKLTAEVAQQLAPRISPPALLVGYSSNAGREADETALGIRVEKAALEGNGRINPSLALCVEARATVFRTRDGAELYSLPIQYRSTARKFTQWGADDARLFRRELDRCYQQISTAIVDQLSERQVIGPKRIEQATLANN